MKKKPLILAKYTSYIFVPPSFTFLIFTYLALVFETNKSIQLWVILHALTIGLILPIFFFIYLRKKGIVADVDATIKEERIQPYFFGVFICFVGAYTAYQSNFLPIIYYLWLVYSINTILIIIINKFWKISAHAIGASTPLGVLVYMYGIYGLIFIPVVIIVGWSRIYLRKHTIEQVVAGAIFGLFLTLIELYYFLNVIS